ncbi:hypothetical protein [Clostridium intestinale]|uniref:hypothetical protein n=1 Tax=Clostridium intestinale TaxID=36845 RepID=UPI0028EE2C84|nr:hypothetical protein [Clostridium intestinale]
MASASDNKVKEARIRKNFVVNESTARMISELRLIHPDVNVKSSDIVEKAIRCYYKYIKEEDGDQREEF